MEREEDRVDTLLADGLPDVAGDAPPVDEPRNSESLDEEDNTLRPRFIRKVTEALDDDDQERVYDLVEPLHPADIADLFELIGGEYRAPLARAINDLLGSEVMAEMNDWVRDDLVEELEPEEVAELAEQMETDDAVAMIEDLDEEDQQAVLAEMEPEDRAAIESALSFPEESAGRLMSRDFIAVPEHLTVGDLIDYMRESRDLATEFWEVFIVDPKHRPVGTCMLSWILRAPRHVALSDVMKRDQTLIPVTMDQEEVALRFQKYALISAAVVDESGRLVGQITVDDVVHIIQEEAGEDVLLLAGAGEGDINEPVVDSYKARVRWLIANLFTALVASFIISRFEGTIERMVALATLMQIVAGVGVPQISAVANVAAALQGTGVPLIADGGRIVNTSSGLARFSLPGYAAYAAMKGGIEVLTRYLAKELGLKRQWLHATKLGFIHPRTGDFMQVFSGRKYWPMDPRPHEVLDVQDAHDLVERAVIDRIATAGRGGNTGVDLGGLRLHAQHLPWSPEKNGANPLLPIHPFGPPSALQLFKTRNVVFCCRRGR